MGSTIKTTDKLIQAVQDSVKTEIINTEGRDFSTRTIHPIPQPRDAEVAQLEVNTLSGIVDYLNANVDKLNPESLVLHIVSHDQVLVRSAIFGKNKQREVYVRASWKTLFGDTFKFDKYVEVEDFIIGLKTLFVATDGVDGIVSIVGNLQQAESRTNADDGFSQTVMRQKGVTGVVRTEIKNPVELQPYRTFREVPQPTSPFILRLQGTDGDSPDAALFEADGGKWKLDAINSIKTYFKSAGVEISIIC